MTSISKILGMSEVETMLYYCEENFEAWKAMKIAWVGEGGVVKPPIYTLNICMELATKFGKSVEHGYCGRFFLGGIDKEDTLVDWNERNKKNKAIYIISYDKRDFNRDDIVSVNEIVQRYGYFIDWYGMKFLDCKIYGHSMGHNHVFSLLRSMSDKDCEMSREELLIENNFLRKKISEILESRTLKIMIPKSWTLACDGNGKVITDRHT